MATDVVRRFEKKCNVDLSSLDVESILLKHLLSKHDAFYADVFQNPHFWVVDRDRRKAAAAFERRSGLGRDVYGMVRRFLKGDLEWYHLLLKHDEFDDFLDSMNEFKDRIAALPFWCLCCEEVGRCDENVLERLSREPHRHLILACEERVGFERVWTDGGRRPKPGERDREGMVRCARIRDAARFLKTIVYVSRKKASCARGIPESLM